MANILETIKNREVIGASDRLNLVFANAAYRASGIIPARYRWIVPAVVQNVSLPNPEFKDVKEEVLRTLAGEEVLDEPVDVEVLTPPPPLYTAYRCLHNNPLQCEWPVQTLAENPEATACVRCGFPGLLPPETQIQGKRGRYQIEAWLKNRNLGRLYQAIDLLDRQPVMIKEYLLPTRHFTGEELRRRQHQFDLFTNIELADRRDPDLRWDVPIDAIAPLGEARAYSILPENPERFPTLGHYLQETGPLSAFLVRSILLQVLQSLEGLHEQKYRLPTGIVQEGILHGNISLDSLLIVPNFQGFYIYLTDPHLWEHQFIPPNQETPEPSVEGDLAALGHVAFYLLAGRSADPGNQQPLDPGVPEYWPEGTPEFLRRYILSLVGLNNLPFESASLARQALLKFPILEPVVVVAKPDAEAEAEKKKKRIPSWVWVLIAMLVGAAVLSLIVWFFSRLNRVQTAAEIEPDICCLEQMPSLPPQKITFTGEQGGVWTYVWRQANLIAKGKTLAGEFNRRLNPELDGSFGPDGALLVPTPPELDEGTVDLEGAQLGEPLSPEEEALILNAEAESAAAEIGAGEDVEAIEHVWLNYVALPSATLALAQVQAQEAEFAVSSLLDNLDIGLWYKTVAYDAIAVYVAFSYAERDKSLPAQLNGRLTLKQLRRLYTGEITNWQELGGPDMAVKLYMPEDEEAIAIFEQRVLQTEEAIAQFRELSSRRTAASAASTQITTLSTFRTLNAVLRDFEGAQIGAIAFGSLSQVFGQCSVYPLALGKGFQAPVSPLLNRRDQPINPTIDLCNEKGSYKVNIAAMRNAKYPLVYPIGVVYPRDNRRDPIGENFAALLQTDEAQLLLQNAGLIPLRDIDEQALEQKLGQ